MRSPLESGEFRNLTLDKMSDLKERTVLREYPKRFWSQTLPCHPPVVFLSHLQGLRVPKKRTQCAPIGLSSVLAQDSLCAVAGECVVVGHPLTGR